MTDSSLLPPKKDVALALLQTAQSVYVHLDPRAPEVLVPAWLKKQPQLVLQVGLNMAVPIPDLEVSDEALSCTLSFNRRPEFCYLPWQAVFGLVGDDGRGMLWPDSVPAEAATQSKGRAAPAKRPALRLAGTEESSAEDERESVDGPDGTSVDQAAAAGGSLTSGAGEVAKESHPSAASSQEQGGTPADSAASSDAGDEQPAGRADPTSTHSGKKRELPPYLRIVK